jgi:type IV secretion system protein VirD4
MTEWLTTKQTAQRLHVHPETLRQRTRKGQLAGVRIETTPGGHRRYAADDIEAYIAGTLEPALPVLEPDAPMPAPKPAYEPSRGRCPAHGAYDAQLCTCGPAFAHAPMTISVVMDRPRRGANKSKARWARDRDLSELMNDQARGISLGRTLSGKRLRMEANHALIFAGTRSGKSSGLMIPAILRHEGPVIATAVKDDLITNTLRHRGSQGTVMVFDPARALDQDLPGARLVGWSPLEGATDWRCALANAQVMIDCALAGSADSGNMQFFANMSCKLLPVLLHAAAVMDEDMRQVLRWLHRIDDPITHGEIDSILRWKRSGDALDVWVGFAKRDPKLRADIAATVTSCLVVYEDPAFQASAALPGGSLEDLMSGDNTLYVVAPMSEQPRVEPIIAGMLSSLMRQLQEAPAMQPRKLLVALDETANVAPLPDLYPLLATSAGHGVSIITAWQDLAQLRARYGDQANAILNNSRAKLVLPGVSDPETIYYFGQMCGDLPARDLAVPGMQVLVDSPSQALLNASTLRQQRFGHGILLYGAAPPARIKLDMFFEDRQLRRLAGLASLPASWTNRLASRLVRS